ncbi:MAG: hypothetical protein ACYTGQ_11680 [Planctomycetota bacterium]|jgi:hypothetical protein
MALPLYADGANSYAFIITPPLNDTNYNRYESICTRGVTGYFPTRPDG